MAGEAERTLLLHSAGYFLIIKITNTNINISSGTNNALKILINLYKIGYSLRMASDKVGKIQPQLLLNIKLEELALHLFNCSEFSWAKASSIYRAMRLS